MNSRLKKITHQHDEAIDIKQNEYSSRIESYRRDHQVKVAEIVGKNTNIRRKFDSILNIFATNKARHQKTLKKSTVFRSWCKYVLSMHLQRKNI